MIPLSKLYYEHFIPFYIAFDSKHKQQRLRFYTRRERKKKHLSIQIWITYISEIFSRKKCTWDCFLNCGKISELPKCSPKYFVTSFINNLQSAFSLGSRAVSKKEKRTIEKWMWKISHPHRTGLLAPNELENLFLIISLSLFSSFSLSQACWIEIFPESIERQRKFMFFKWFLIINFNLSYLVRGRI